MPMSSVLQHSILEMNTLYIDYTVEYCTYDSYSSYFL